VKYALLPVASLLLSSIFAYDNVLGEDYFMFAEVKGLKKTAISYRRSMRNILLP